MHPAVTRHRRGSAIRSDAAAVAAASALLAAGAAPQIISGPLAPYLRLDLGISSSELGLGLSLSAVPAVVLAVWLGRVTDRVGGINVGRLNLHRWLLFRGGAVAGAQHGVVRGVAGRSRDPAGAV